MIVDTAGSAIDLMLTDIMQRNPKMRMGSQPTLQAYGALKSGFSLWLKQIHLCKVDVVLIAHAAEEQRGDDTVERIDAAGSSKNTIYKMAQIMGFLSFDGDGKRRIDFDPVHGTYRKNVGLAPMDIPDPATAPDTLAHIIAEAKVRINEMADRHSDEVERLTAISRQVSTISTPEAMNELTDRLNDPANPGEPVERRIVGDRGRSIGLYYDKRTKHWFKSKEDSDTEVERIHADAAVARPPDSAPEPTTSKPGGTTSAPAGTTSAPDSGTTSTPPVAALVPDMSTAPPESATNGTPEPPQAATQVPGRVSPSPRPIGKVIETPTGVFGVMSRTVDVGQEIILEHDGHEGVRWVTGIEDQQDGEWIVRFSKEKPA